MVYQWGFERDIEFLHEVEIYGMIRTSHLSLAKKRPLNTCDICYAYSCTQGQKISNLRC